MGRPNDAYFLSQYARQKNLKAVLAARFARAGAKDRKFLLDQ
jgi:hypothetical protein